MPFHHGFGYLTRLLATRSSDPNQSGRRSNFGAVLPVKVQKIYPSLIVEDPGGMIQERLKLDLSSGLFGIVLVLQVLQKLLVQFLFALAADLFLHHADPF